MENKGTEHDFLAKMGNSRLRPGGKLATDWLIQNGDFDKDSNVLQVACNSGNTAIELADKYGCKITGIDINDKVLEKARENVKKRKLDHLITLEKADLIQLPFADNSFDIVLNEAMLTMLSSEDKQQAISEYYRVLKPNGLLLTHDVLLPENNNPRIITDMGEVIHFDVYPLQREEWKQVFIDGGFRNIDIFSGPLSLLSLKSIFVEEGIVGTSKMVCNALKKENFNRIKQVFKTLHDKQNPIMFIAVCSQK